ncbi:MAG TPA: prolyl oligopeptidase family serine peptidase [Acidobacteriaceae bacterium]|jgi:poly(3-hydroxybutyrate) depolymerase|nr:prolyl oligopeptidase family serine peptidase [Acidobacteriaceae bacterium]
MLRPACLALFLACLAIPVSAAPHRQDTGFLNRTIDVNGVSHRYVVYLPENWSRDQRWPVILFLHGSGERGSEGMDETQIGLPQAIRLHPERWPFVVVMPQVPFNRHHWTDPEMMGMAIGALYAEVKEFRGDTDRLYLTGLSLGGYGVWEIAKDYPHRFAALVPVSGGVFWSYEPERWREVNTLPGEYARVVGRTPAWIFHGADDPIVNPRQSLLMYEALKANGGDVRFWEYAGVRHNVWDRAYGEPQLPRWLLAQRLSAIPRLSPASEQILIPIHPVPARIDPALYNAYVGEYEDQSEVVATIYRQGDRLLFRSRAGDITELLPENTATFFYPTGGPRRITFERDSEGRVTGIRFRDDRHEEFWERRR